MITNLSAVLTVIGATGVATVLLATIVCALLDDVRAAAEERELARLTEPLPGIGGRHRPENAPGTRTQRRLDDTSEYDLIGLDELLAVLA